MRTLLAFAVLVLSVAKVVAQPTRPPLPDIEGIRLGMTLTEVKARLAELKLKINSEERMQINGLPNGPYVWAIQALTATSENHYELAFSPPPATSRLQYVRRRLSPLPTSGVTPPLASAVLDAIIGKFGTPSKRVTQAQGANEQMTFVWSADGRLAKTDPGMECRKLADKFQPRHQLEGSNDQAGKLISQGCGIWMWVVIQAAPSGVLESLQHTVVDVAGADAARRETARALETGTQRQNEQERQKSSQQKPSI